MAAFTGQITGFHGVLVVSPISERVPGVGAADPDQGQHVGDEEDEGEGVEAGAACAATAPHRVTSMRTWRRCSRA